MPCLHQVLDFSLCSKQLYLIFTVNKQETLLINFPNLTEWMALQSIMAASGQDNSFNFVSTWWFMIVGTFFFEIQMQCYIQY